MSVRLAGATVVERLDPVCVSTCDLVVAGGRIGTGGERTDGVRDCSGCLIVPGNVCAHTHLYSALARGMPYRLEPPRDFLQILQRVWWRLDRALDEPSVRASALVGGLEALLAGTTTLIDHHASPNSIDGSLDAIADALSALGARAVLCYETSDRDGPERAAAGVAENRRFLRRVRDERPPLVRALVGAHACFTLSDETLSACVEVAEELDSGLHVHAAEDGVDRHVVARLELAEALGPRTLLAHGVHLDAEELAHVAETSTWLAHNARSNMNNAVGRAHVEALAHRLPLGTDGIGADMYEEGHAAYFRLREDGDAAGADWPLARLADGARLAGQLFGEPLLGQLVPGAPADLVVLDYDAPAPLDAASLPGHWVYGLSSRWVRDVMVAGEWAVLDRRLANADQAQLVDAARAEAAQLWERLDELGPHDFSPKGGRQWAAA